MKGIDISAWQENIDWQAVKDAGIEFVIIKLGQNYRLDSMFIDHVNNVVAYGLRYGVYLYSKATTIEDAQAEADWVHKQIKQYLNGKNPEMGIWFDMEDPSIEASGADITSLCAAFVNRLWFYGYNYVGVYSSYNWLTNGNIRTDELDVAYWCAQYYRRCDFEHPNLKIWQFTESLEIAGMNFDGNIYFE